MSERWVPASALADALEGMETMSCQIGEYFRDKHDHAGYMSRARTALAGATTPPVEAGPEAIHSPEDIQARIDIILAERVTVGPDRWRTGRKVGRTLYRQTGETADDRDELIGVMDTPQLADLVVTAVNALNLISVPEPAAPAINRDVLEALVGDMGCGLAVGGNDDENLRDYYNRLRALLGGASKPDLDVPELVQRLRHEAARCGTYTDYDLGREAGYRLSAQIVAVALGVPTTTAETPEGQT